VPYSGPRACCCRTICRPGDAEPGQGGSFLSESPRNRAEPVTLWTWPTAVRRIALAANLPRLSTHTTRHLCLTDLARMGWELHAIATFAGHRSTGTYVNCRSTIAGCRCQAVSGLIGARECLLRH
jgi:integrase/recombinase XerD